MFEINPTYLPFIPAAVGTSWDEKGILLTGHGTGDAGVFSVPFKCEVERAQLTITVATEAGAAEVKFDKRPTAGSDTSRGDGDIADINIGVAGVSAQGEVAYDLVAAGVTLEPGQQVVVQVITANTGQVIPELIVRYLPETLANLSALQATT